MSPLELRHAFLEPRRKRETVSGYRSLGHIVAATAERIFTPPEDIRPSLATEKYVKIETAGAWTDFSNTTTPYMTEPLDVTESREHNGCVFVGPAQCGKTASLILAKMAYNIRVSHMDLMIVCQSGAAATDFAVRRVDRTIAHSEELKAQILAVRNSDNQKRKHFKSGMLLTIAHPTKNELSGKPIGNVIITDYDRIDDDIDGEGSAWTQSTGRTKTFGSYKMTVAESSPSRLVNDPRKILEPHEAPDCTGILELYNRGDRRMWYWPCPSCDAYFSPNWSMIKWDETAGDHKAQSETARLICPHCEFAIHPDQRHDMQQWGMWRSPEGRRSDIASFWLDGTAAAFATWGELVVKFLDAQKKFDDTLDDADLKTFWNQDLGRPYIPKSQETERTPEILMSRREPMTDKGIVPNDVRCLVHCIDVQKNYFQVQTHGIMVGVPFDIVIIDYFRVHRSVRIDEHGDHYQVRPATFQEDWDLLVDEVITRQYRTTDGRRMEARLTLCDAGGHAEKFNVRTPGSGGVTEKAYQFYRDIARRGLAGRFHLVRGANSRGGKRAWIDRPDGNSGTLGIARGDVPILYLHSNELKDILSTRLDVTEPHKGLVRFPAWLNAEWFGELCAERWTEKGWVKRVPRNEAWDLLYYLVGASFSPLLPMERVDWGNPPAWLAPWDDNPFVLPADDDVDDEGVEVVVRPFSPRRQRFDFKALGEALG